MISDLSELNNNMEVLMIAFSCFKLPFVTWRLTLPAFTLRLFPFKKLNKY